MKLNSKLTKLVTKLVQLSFDKEGRLKSSEVEKNIKMLKNQSGFEAIQALVVYLRQLKREIQKRTLVIESAVTLTEIQQDRIVRSFNTDFPVSYVSVKLNPSLLGGLRVKIGDTVFDNSVQSKILQVKEKIIQA